MIEPLFMRFIIDRVLLNETLDRATRLSQLHLAGAFFVAVIVVGNMMRVIKDYRQKLLNVSVMLSLRRSLFDRMLHLPLAKLYDMKTGGILSRLTGDVETTSGLLQMAVVSPSLSVIRLVIAVSVLMALNWRLALTAMAIIPGIMVMSLGFTRRIRPIYRSVRKDAEIIDGRVGETFSGIRVVRAFAREIRELGEYMLGRHTVLRKELFAHRRELLVWTSWGLLTSAVNVVIVWYGGYLNVMGDASVGDIMAFQWYTFLLMNPVWNLVNSFSELQRSLAAMERVFEVLEMENDKPDRPGALDAPRRRPGDPLRERRVRVPRGPAGRPRLQRRRPRRLGRRAGGPQRRRQDDGHRPGGAVPRSDARAHPDERHRHPRLQAGQLPQPAGDRAAGRVPVRRLGARQHRLRAQGRHRRRGRGRGPPRQRPRVHRAAARAVRRRRSASAA